MRTKEPCRTKLKNAGIAAKSGELPKIPKALLDQIALDAGEVPLLLWERSVCFYASTSVAHWPPSAKCVASR